MELYLGYMQSFKSRFPPEEMGFDVAIDFEPDFYTEVINLKPSMKDLIYEKIKSGSSAFRNNRVVEYSLYADSRKKISVPDYKQFPSITPMWDNTARRKTGAFILKDSTPELYESWLRTLIEKFHPYSTEENFIFINAWNEWAEGNHLEPDLKWGDQYLRATKRAMDTNGA